MADCVGLLGFCGREEERGSEKEINKKINSVWLRCKKKKKKMKKKKKKRIDVR